MFTSTPKPAAAAMEAINSLARGVLSARSARRGFDDAVQRGVFSTHRYEDRQIARTLREGADHLERAAELTRIARPDLHLGPPWAHLIPELRGMAASADHQVLPVMYEQLLRSAVNESLAGVGYLTTAAGVPRLERLAEAARFTEPAVTMLRWDRLDVARQQMPGLATLLERAVVTTASAPPQFLHPTLTRNMESISKVAKSLRREGFPDDAPYRADDAFVALVNQILSVTRQPA